MADMFNTPMFHIPSFQIKSFDNWYADLELLEWLLNLEMLAKTSSDPRIQKYYSEYLEHLERLQLEQKNCSKEESPDSAADHSKEITASHTPAPAPSSCQQQSPREHQVLDSEKVTSYLKVESSDPVAADHSKEIAVSCTPASPLPSCQQQSPEENQAVSNSPEILDGEKITSYSKEELVELAVADHREKTTVSASNTSPRDLFCQDRFPNKSPTRTYTPQSQVAPNPPNSPTPTPTSTYFPSTSERQTSDVISATRFPPEEKPPSAPPPSAPGERSALTFTYFPKVSGQQVVDTIPVICSFSDEKHLPVPPPSAPGEIFAFTYFPSISGQQVTDTTLEICSSLIEKHPSREFGELGRYLNYAKVANFLLARRTWNFDDLVQAIENSKLEDQPEDVWSEHFLEVAKDFQKAFEEG